MAPVEPDLFSSNLKATAIFTGYFATAAGLTALVLYRTIYMAYQALPPSQATRTASSNRHRYMQLFTALATTSLAMTWYHMYRYLLLSYRVWAHQMGEPLPTGLWTHRGILGEQPTGLALGRWLQDTPLFLDAWEIVTEQSRRFWWGQQIFLLAAAWSVFLGLEGHKRNIHHLWAFMLLGQVVAMSFAMNLFFLAMILTPIPLPRKPRLSTSTTIPISRRRRTSTTPNRNTTSDLTQKPFSTVRTFFSTSIHPYLLPPLTTPHPPTWTPHPLIYITTFLPIFYICVFLLPFSSSTPQFLPLVLTPYLLLFRPLYLDRLVPSAYGSTRSSHRSYLGVWRFIAGASTVLYLKQSLVALLDNDPGPHSHRHSAYLAYLHLAHGRDRGVMTRSASAVGRIFGALGDHPAVAVVGSDVVMCALSLAAWSVVRGMEVQKIGEAIGVGGIESDESPPPSRVNAGQDRSSQKRVSTTSTSTSTTMPRGRRGRKPTRRAAATAAATTTKEGEDEQDSDPDYPGTDFDADADPDDAPAAVALVEHVDREANYEAGAATWGIFTLGGLGAMAAGVLGAEAER